MKKLVAGLVLAAIVGSPAFAQSNDLDIRSANREATESVGTYVRPLCKARRVQFSDAFAWRVRLVFVCCVSAQCTYQVWN